MTPTPRQREEWERKRLSLLDFIKRELESLEPRTEELIRERDRVEAMTFEDSYFQFLSERE